MDPKLKPGTSKTCGRCDASETNYTASAPPFFAESDAKTNDGGV